jgi:hypothetical protein
MPSLKHKWGALLLLFACSCHATSVVVIVSPAYIVVGSDSRSTIAGNTSINSETATKIFIVQNHIVVADLGVARLDDVNGRVGYDFAIWLNALSKTFPANVSVSQVTSAIESKSRETFVGFDRAFIKTHRMPQPTSADWFQSLATYVIAGYENGRPSVQTVEFYIDWITESLIGPIKGPLHKEAGVGIDSYLVALGHNGAIGNFHNRNSYMYKQCIFRSPRIFKKLLSAPMDMTVVESKRIVQTLIQVQEEVEPNEVGGDIQIGTINQFTGASREIVNKSSKSDHGSP